MRNIAQPLLCSRRTKKRTSPYRLALFSFLWSVIFYAERSSNAPRLSAMIRGARASGSSPTAPHWQRNIFSVRVALSCSSTSPHRLQRTRQILYCFMGSALSFECEPQPPLPVETVVFAALGPALRKAAETGLTEGAIVTGFSFHLVPPRSRRSSHNP